MEKNERSYTKRHRYRDWLLTSDGMWPSSRPRKPTFTTQKKQSDSLVHTGDSTVAPDSEPRSSCRVTTSPELSTVPHLPAARTLHRTGTHLCELVSKKVVRKQSVEVHRDQH